MSQLTGSSIFKAIVGLFSALDSTDQTTLKKQLWRKTARCSVTDGGTAGTAQTETFVWQNNTGGDVVVTACNVVTPVAVTAHGTTYATFLLYKRTSAGASQATIGSFATDTVTTDDMTAFAPKALTLTAANVIVPDGYVLTCAVTKASTGVAIASATAQAVIEVTYEPVV